MRFKVDENLPHEVCNLLSGAGHDAISVGQQGLGGAADAQVYRLCQSERRVLVTLDVDFANVQAYDPKSSVGVIVLRLARQDRRRVLDAVATSSRCWSASRWRTGCGSSKASAYESAHRPGWLHELPALPIASPCRCP